MRSLVLLGFFLTLVGCDVVGVSQFNGTNDIHSTINSNPSVTSHTVTFDKNSASATGVMAQQTIAIGESASLKANEFSLTGYAFSGWAVLPDGAKVYDDGARFAMGPKDVVLYAVWTKTGNSSKDITSFGLISPAATGTITELSSSSGSIAISVPFGTIINPLKATFSTTGATVTVAGVNQVSGVSENSFANPVAYVVTATDGTTKTYTVTVTVSSSTAKDITAFGFTSPAATGNIVNTSSTEGTIDLTVPFATSLSSLVATFSTSGSSVKVSNALQVSGTTGNNFTNPVAYVVTAADGSTKTYTVTVTVALNTAKEITAFSFPSQVAAANITNTSSALGAIEVTMPFGTNVTALAATFSAPGASVTVGGLTQVSGSTTKNFTGPVDYVVTAANNSTKTYTVTVTVAPKPAFATFSINSTAAIVSGTSLQVNLIAGTTVTALSPVFTVGANQTVKVGTTIQNSGASPQDFTSPVSYIISDLFGSSPVTYTVSVSEPTGVGVSVPQAVTVSIAGNSGATNLKVSSPFFQSWTLNASASPSATFVGWYVSDDAGSTSMQVSTNPSNYIVGQASYPAGRNYTLMAVYSLNGNLYSASLAFSTN